MKNIKLIILPLCLFVFLLLPHLAQAEEIFGFETQINVKSDSSIEVTEKIQYDFGALQRHGIFREIPYKYKARHRSDHQ